VFCGSTYHPPPRTGRKPHHADSWLDYHATPLLWLLPVRYSYPTTSPRYLPTPGVKHYTGLHYIGGPWEHIWTHATQLPPLPSCIPYLLPRFPPFHAMPGAGWTAAYTPPPNASASPCPPRCRCSDALRLTGWVVRVRPDTARLLKLNGRCGRNLR